MGSESVSPFNIETVTLVVGLAIGAYFLLRRNPRLKQHLDNLGGPPSYPIVGCALSFLRPPHEFLGIFKKWEKQYGTVCGAWIGNFIPYVFVSDPNAVEKLLSTSNHIDKGNYVYSLLHAWLGTGLLTAPRKKWFARRKLLTPSFHFKILEDFIPIFNEQASVLVNCLEKDEKANGQTFDIYPYITRCTLDIICETAMGKKINAQTSTVNKKYIDAVNGFCRVILLKSAKPWLRLPIVYHLSSISSVEKDYLRTMKGFTEQVIQARKVERRTSEKPTSDIAEDSAGIYGFISWLLIALISTPTGKKRKAFLDLLLDTSETEQGLTDNDIREEVDTFMFEGHDTTGVSLAWTLFLLGLHPECQKLVHEELDDIFADDPTRDVTTVDISKMKYLECCVKESLRLYPSVPFIMRQVDHDISLSDGKIIPQGSTAFVAIYFLHRNSEQFPEPEKFKPERFSLDSPKRHPYSYVPFSAGSRNCIGQKFALTEEKIVLAKLLRAFKFQTVESRENIRVVPDVVLRSEKGVHVIMQKR